MPNPLMRMMQRPSKTPTDRPQPIPPVPESYAGTNFAWRGTETHGVATTQGTMDPEGIGFDADSPDHRATFVPIDPNDEAHDERPIPVRIVQEYKREIRRWSADRRTAVPGQVDPVVGRDEDRTRFLIRNISTAKVLYVGNEAATVALMGYRLDAGQEISLATEEPVFVTTTGVVGTDECAYQFIVEYVRGE